MAQDLVINGNTVVNVDRIDALNVTGDVVVYLESPYPTTGETVAKIDDTEYKSVAEALSKSVSGDTVLMVADSDESGKTLVIPTGVTLSLNGKILEANSVVAVGNANVIDTLRTGTLRAPQNSVVLAKTNSYVPLWDTSANGYKFTQHSITDNAQGMGITKDDTADTATIKFVVFFRDRALLLDGNDDNNLEIMAQMKWNADTGRSEQNFIFSNDMVSQVVTANGSKAFSTSVNNYSKLNGLTMQVIIKSGTGAQFAGTLFSVNG